MKTVQFVARSLKQIAVAGTLIAATQTASATFMDYDHDSKYSRYGSHHSGYSWGGSSYSWGGSSHDWGSSFDWGSLSGGSHGGSYNFGSFDKFDLDAIFDYDLSGLLDDLSLFDLEDKLALIDDVWGFDFADACGGLFDGNCGNYDYDEVVAWIEELAIDLSAYEHIGDLIELGLDYFAEYCQPGTGEPAPVPVPASMWLFGSALLGFNLIGRKKR
ncbi:hypothetical protein GYB62_03545 [bacterium]|nr:hypothetical protein [bacterium]